MYLSELTFDPWRRDVPRLLADSYALHQRLLTAFPDAADGGSGQVLFRAEFLRDTPSILVQSEQAPNWLLLETLLCTWRGPKRWQPTFTEGQTLRFRLRANMTVKQNGKRRVLYGASAEETRQKQAAWLVRKGEQHGFTLMPVPRGGDWFDPFSEEEAVPDAQPYYVRLSRQTVRQGIKPAGPLGKPLEIAHTGVDCDGVLRVTDAALFAAAVMSGIGPAKAFGFGLLSVGAIR